jgi:hypothetical protein
MGLQKRYSDVQLFTLTYLTAEEQKQEERGEAFGQPSPPGMPRSYRFTTSINELSNKIPPSSIPDQLSGKEIFSHIKNQIDELKNDELLKEDTQLSFDRQPQDQAFYITSPGKLFIRKHYRGLIPLIENKKGYEKIIDQLEADSNNKKYLKKLRDKLVGKTEDKIIDTMLSEIIENRNQYSHILLRFLMQLLHQASQYGTVSAD